MLTGVAKATFVSLAAYALAVLIGLSIGLWFTLGAVPVFQVAWCLFCTIRLVQLWRSRAYEKAALAYDRESFGFALGGLLSSCLLFTLLAAWTQFV